MSENERPGRVIWITGLSGAGKTTLARALANRLPGAALLDGDELREVLGTTGACFDSEGRRKLALTYARLAALLASQGFTVIVATISLFHAVHDWNRANIKNYLEVFLDVPESVRRKRDPKGLYRAEAQGRIMDMAGGGTAVELPLAPHLRLDAEQSVDECVAVIVEALSG